jgi:hypothetical protein
MPRIFPGHFSGQAGIPAYGLQILQGAYPAPVAASEVLNVAVQLAFVKYRHADLWNILLSGLPLYCGSESAAIETSAAPSSAAAMRDTFFIFVSLLDTPDEFPVRMRKNLSLF